MYSFGPLPKARPYSRRVESGDHTGLSRIPGPGTTTRLTFDCVSYTQISVELFSGLYTDAATFRPSGEARTYMVERSAGPTCCNSRPERSSQAIRERFSSGWYTITPFSETEKSAAAAGWNTCMLPARATASPVNRSP